MHVRTYLCEMYSISQKIGICVYIYIHIHLHICIYTYIHIYRYVYMHVVRIWPIKGVNLGGWLLLEPGPSYPLFMQHPLKDKSEAPWCITGVRERR